MKVLFLYFLFSGLVLSTTTGDSSTFHQHFSGHNVFQATHVASACGAFAPFRHSTFVHTFHKNTIER